MNPAATAMVRGLPSVRRLPPLPLYGTLAWVGEHDQRGLHVDMSPDRVRAVMAHASAFASG